MAVDHILGQQQGFACDGIQMTWTTAPIVFNPLKKSILLEETSQEFVKENICTEPLKHDQGAHEETTNFIYVLFRSVKLLESRHSLRESKTDHQRHVSNKLKA